MASIRKYQLPKRYRDGGRVVADMVLAPDDAPEPAQEVLRDGGSAPEPEPEPSPAMKTTVDGRFTDESPLQRAIEAQRHAEELARQRPASPSIRANIKALEQSDPFRYRAASFHYAQGLMEGVADESPEMTARILAGIQAEVRHLQEQAADNVHDRGAAILPPERAIRTSPEPMPAPLLPPRRRTVPLSAPVSRDVPTASGGRASDRRIRLSPEEIDLSHRSFTADNMSNAEKELLYATNKARMLRMKANGEMD